MRHLLNSIVIPEGNNVLNVHLVPLAPPVIDLEIIAILSINGESFTSVGIDPDGIPFGVLSEPVAMSRLRGVAVFWQNRTISFYYEDIVGLTMRLFYKPTWFAPYPYDSPPAFKGAVRVIPSGQTRQSGVFDSSVGVYTLFGHGYYAEGVYDGEFVVGYQYWDTPGPGFASFRVKNMVRCTGTGSTE